MGIGVQKRLGVARDGDMALPENQIAAPQVAERRRFAEREFLHVAVARAGDAGGLQRNLDQARAIEPERRLAAPQIGRAEKSLRRRRRNPALGLDRRQMRHRHMPADAVTAKRSSCRATASARPSAARRPAAA